MKRPDDAIYTDAYILASWLVEIVPQIAVVGGKGPGDEFDKDSIPNALGRVNNALEKYKGGQ